MKNQFPQTVILDTPGGTLSEEEATVCCTTSASKRAADDGSLPEAKINPNFLCTFGFCSGITATAP